MKLKESLLAHPVFYRLVSSLVDRDKLQAIKRLENDFSGLKILDLGCGLGNSVRLFDEAAYTGIDINSAYIKIAERNYPGRNFIVGDANRVNWGDRFDIILINSFLHHLDNNQVSDVISKSAKSLKSEGRLIIQEPLLPEDREWGCRLMMRLDRGSYFRPLDGWKSLLQQAGFSPEKISLYSLRLFGIEGYKMVSMSLRKARGTPIR